MPSVITSPGFRKMGLGFLPNPTPGGVPVVMMSPGSSVISIEQYDTMVAMSKIIVLVLPVCMRSPLTSSHIASLPGLPTSSAVTSHGPIGPKVSKPLPLSHVYPRSI